MQVVLDVPKSLLYKFNIERKTFTQEWKWPADK